MWQTFLVVACCAAQPASRLEIKTQDDGTKVSLVVSLEAREARSLAGAANRDELAGQMLQLRLFTDRNRLGPAIFGRYRIAQSKLVFEPRYRLMPERTYRAQLLDRGEILAEKDYTVPKRQEEPAATVERICPGVEELPANCLKFYVYFSKPMREGRGIFDKIYLLDDRGKRIPDVWRRVELWTPDTRRLTLWIHPGRVKQGVNLREEFGPVLQPNRSYTLVVGSDLWDADGQPLGKRFTKKFRTTASDYRRPLPQRWKTHSPAAGTREPLVVNLGESLDHALLERCLTVRASDNARIAGQVEIAQDAATWQFTPKARWSADDYKLTISPLLEDQAANTPLRRFDTDLTQPPGPSPELERTFRPRD